MLPHLVQLDFPCLGLIFLLCFMMSVLKLQNTFLVVSVACVRGLCETWGRGARRCAVAAWPVWPARLPHTGDFFTFSSLSLRLSRGEKPKKFK